MVTDNTPFRDSKWAVVEQTPKAGSRVDLDDPIVLGAGPLDKSETKKRLSAGSPASV